MMKRLLHLFVFFALICPGVSWGAIAVDVHGKGTVGIASSQTTSATLGASATQLFVGVVWGGSTDRTISSVTWNGISMTEILKKTTGAGLNHHSAVYGLNSPATGTHDIVVTFSGTPGDGHNTYYLSLTGGDTTTGWRTATGRQDSDGTGPGLTDGSWASGDYEVHVANVYAATVTFDAGETVQQDNNMGGSSLSGGMSYKSSSGTVGCTDTSFYSEVAVAAIPASGGGGGAARSLMLLGVGP